MWLKFCNGRDVFFNLELVKKVEFYGESSNGRRVHIDGTDVYISAEEEAQLLHFFKSKAETPVTTVGNTAETIHHKVEGVFSTVTKNIQQEIKKQQLYLQPKEPQKPTSNNSLISVLQEAFARFS